MQKIPKAEYTAEFKELGLIEQTRRNWVKALRGSPWSCRPSKSSQRPIQDGRSADL